MSNVVDVYWSTPFTSKTGIPKFILNIDEPLSISEELAYFSKSDHHSANNFTRCPSYQQFLKNKFLVTSPVKYNLKFKNEQVSSDYYDQDFFDDYVLVRDSKNKLVGFHFFTHIFFCEESLSMEMMQPFLSSNQFNKNNILIPGEFDISKWFRPLEVAFIVKDDPSEFTINVNDPLYYLSFKTTKKVNFKKFYFTERCTEILDSCYNEKKYSDSNRNIKTYFDVVYKKFTQSKYNKALLKEIKNNLLDD